MGDLLKLLRPKYTPVAIYHTKEFPSYASKPSEEHCVVASMFVPAWENGRTVAMSVDLVGCAGALNGLGLGGESPENRIKLIAGYAQGTEDRPGRHIFCCSEAGKEAYLDKVPVYGSRDDIVVVQPVDEAEDMDAPIEVVSFLVDAIELSALVTLSSFDGLKGDSVIRSSFALSCEQLFAMPRQEGDSKEPRMVLGMTEFFPRRFLDDGRVSVSMPYCLYKRMDENASKSFLNDDRWRQAAQPKKCDDCCC
jgi:hypothetical protein